MQFTGNRLKAILSQQRPNVDVLDGDGHRRGSLAAKAAIEVADGYIGIGNQSRIRSLQPWTKAYYLNGGSVTTMRIRDACGMLIVPPPHVDHRPIPH